MTPASTPHRAEKSTPLRKAARRGRWAALVLNAGFFAYLGFWLSKNVNRAALLSALQEIPPGALLVAMALNVCVLICYGARLAALLRAKIPPCFLVAVIGFTFNALLPFRIGEGVKIYFGAAWFDLPPGGLGAAVALEKLYDVAALLLLAALAALGAQSAIIGPGLPTLLTLALLLFGCGLLILWLRRRGAPPHPGKWLPPPLRARLQTLAAQAETALIHQNIPRAALFTALIWTVHAGLVFYLFGALLPGVPFSPLDAVTLLVIAALAIAAPLTPAGLGMFEAGVVAYLTAALDVPQERAISAALAYHLAIAAPHTLIVAMFFGWTFLRQLKARLAP